MFRQLSEFPNSGRVYALGEIGYLIHTEANSAYLQPEWPIGFLKQKECVAATHTEGVRAEEREKDNFSE